LLRTTLVYFGFCLIICGASHAQPAATSTGQPDASPPAVTGVEPQRVFLYDRTVSFVPPEGFTPPSDEVVRRKFANATTPATVYANERATTSVAISYHPLQALAPEQLPEFKSVMKSFLDEQQPGLEWLKNEFVEINGVRWIHFEFLSPAVDAKIHNDMYFTSVNQRMLLFNFNSTHREYSKYEHALARSKASIRVRSK
jgi:hypothetical protein